MKHNDDGARAEAEVCEYLQKNKFKILDTNWKTRWCEIDVIAQKDGCIHFVEVKYRSKASQGAGFDYVTDTKLRQMKFAAEFWIANNDGDKEYVLSAAEVSGPDFAVNLIEEI